MSFEPGARTRAALVAAAVFALGLTTGVAVDRWVLRPGDAAAVSAELTAEGLATALRLSPEEAAEVKRALDAQRATVIRASLQGADSLRVAGDQARAAIERALPRDRVPAFRDWMRHHHERMMEDMGPRMPGMRHRMRPMMRGAPSDTGLPPQR